MSGWITVKGLGAKNLGAVLAASAFLSAIVQAAFTLALAGLLYILQVSGAQSATVDMAGIAESIVAAPIIGFLEGAVGAWLLNLFARQSLLGGFDVFIDDCQSGWPAKPAGGKNWVKFRLQGAYNTGKVAGAYAAVAGALLGVFAAIGIIAYSLSAGIQAISILLAICAIILCPVLLGVIGFLTGVVLAAFLNFVRQARFVNGQDLLVGAAARPASGSAGGACWTKILRIGAINNAKFCGLTLCLIGIPVGIILSALLYSDMGAAALLVLVGVPLALGLFGALSGLLQAGIVNFTLARGFVNGLDARISFAGPAAAAQTRALAFQPAAKAKARKSGKKKPGKS